MDWFVVSIDDFKMVLGKEFLDQAKVVPMSFINSMSIMGEGKTCMVLLTRFDKAKSKTLSAKKIKYVLKHKGLVRTFPKKPNANEVAQLYIQEKKLKCGLRET